MMKWEHVDALHVDDDSEDADDECMDRNKTCRFRFQNMKWILWRKYTARGIWKVANKKIQSIFLGK